MRLYLVMVAGLAGALVLAAHAASGAGKPVGKEKDLVWKEMLEKYDTNKDGHLDRKERAGVSPQDLEKMEKVGLIQTDKKSNSKKTAPPKK
jgi:hypothetical protein